MAYIIDGFNRFSKWDREHACHRFKVNENWYAIYSVEMKWGIPQLNFSAIEDKNADQYYVYETLEEAMHFVNIMKGLN